MRLSAKPSKLRLILLAGAFALATTAAGCGEEESAAAPVPTAAPPPPAVTVEPEPTPEPEPEPTATPEPTPEPEPEPTPEPEPEPAPEPEESGPEIDLEIDAGELFDAFIDDKDAALAEFSDRYARISGRIQENFPAGRGGFLTVVGGDNINGVICTLGAEGYEGAKDRQIGEDITITGKIVGFIYDVAIEDCQVEA